MIQTDFEAYQMITQGYVLPTYEYTSPEIQGLSIKKCTILESKNLEYSNSTTLNTAQFPHSK